MLLRSLLLACCLTIATAFSSQGVLHATQLQQRSAVSGVSMVTAATKPQRVNRRNREYNKKYKSEMRTRIKRVEEAYEEGDYGVAVPLLSKAFAIIDKNVKRNIVHKNTAARKKSQLALKVKTLEGGAPAAAAAPESSD